MDRVIRIGTRGSALALTQTQLVADELERAGAKVEIITVSTPGDRSSAPIAEIGVGVFTSALRDALAEGAIDVAVHSYKDLPTAPDSRLSLAAVPRREDPRDALIARDGLTLGELPPGSRLGTGSPRRAAQLRALGFGHEIVPIRGNVDTRIAMVTSGALDGVVLARAGLSRLGRLDEITETLDPIQMLPAPAQGALAVECRVDDVDVEHLLQSTVDDEATRVAVAAERAMLAALEAGCSAPVGALAEVVEDLDADDRVVHRLSLRGVAAAYDANDPAGAVDIMRASATGDLTAGEQLGRALAAELLELGAGVLSGPEA
ncbi:hydroxymethylbilane synthase [Actinokineospora globicatena]|uniref:hydroxymethylbilane synthase n=1 Tax=Actinokineospora globicatena TaxID=103729 RepID=UPI0020A504E2|nr:hydroxymethylbilane synthase [Actinokineospora globicatena]MCP2301686.1 hydroxymethylbilane synthase [Actinokineospora globicatena]GLW76659.1 porphobilinogen deaminase [Actinokineospora globicatena]GLW83492.1 porphobilinogen deaminase [Actinokineospora globicatena]